VGQSGLGLIEEICHIYSNYPEFHTQVLVASVRNTTHIVESAKIGADIVTAPAKILLQLIDHPLTDKGLSAFTADWKKTGQTIIL
jgi:transaldolase